MARILPRSTQNRDSWTCRLIASPKAQDSHRIVADEHTERGYPKGRFAAINVRFGSKAHPVVRQVPISEIFARAPALI